MKIYNVIEWEWNDKTKQMEEVYSDGYEYDGPVDLMKDSDDKPITEQEFKQEIGGNEGMTPPTQRDRPEGTLVNTDYIDMCVSEQDANSLCCGMSEYVTMWTNADEDEYTFFGYVSNPGQTCPENYIPNPIMIYNFNVANGQAPGFCCIPSNVYHINWDGGFGNAPIDLDGQNTPAFSALASLDTFNGMTFHQLEYGSIPNMFPPVPSTSNMLCSMVESAGIDLDGDLIPDNPIMINAEQGFGGGDLPGMECDCSLNTFYEIQPGDCTGYTEGGDNCRAGVPCDFSGANTYNNSYKIQTGYTPNQCDVTDACGVCGGNGSSCTDCAGVPNGPNRTDICGNCIDCSDASAYPDGTVDWDGGGSCSQHMAWDMICTGCHVYGGGVCNANESVLLNYEFDGEGELQSCVNADGQNECMYNANDTLAIGGDYCPAAGEPGYGQVPGCCWYPNSWCDCDGVLYDNETYCDCSGNEWDDCGNCWDAGSARNIDEEAPLIINGVEVGYYDTANHQGLYDYQTSLGSIYCDCNDTTTQVLECYDKTDPSETLLQIMACPDDICTDFNVNYTSDITLAQDPGCMDPDSCNYKATYDFDCSGNEWVDVATSDTSCCVYPVTWCHSMNSIYNSSPDGIDGTGFQYLCDVKGPTFGADKGKPTALQVFCPLCNMEDYGMGLQVVPFYDWSGENAVADYPFCGTNGYVTYEYTGGASAVPLPPEVPGGGAYQIVNFGDMIIDGIWDPVDFGLDPTLDFWMIAAPPPEITGYPVDDLPHHLKDTCTFSSGCGYTHNRDGNVFTLEGCADPGSLDNQAGTGLQPLYWTADFPTNMHIEEPVETCNYCPKTTAEYNDNLLAMGGCVGGYEFMWSGYIAGTGISSNAFVSSGADSVQNPFFYLGSEQSTEIVQGDSIGYNSGHCYCKDDLDFLADVGALIDGNPQSTNDHTNSDHPLNIIRGYEGATMEWDIHGRLVRLITSPGCNGTDEQSVRDCQNMYLQAQGPIPPSIAYANRLQHLDLSYGLFNGALPQEIQELTDLTYLDLGYNDLSVLPENSGTGHGVFDGEYIGICRLIQLQSTGFGQEVIPGSDIWRPKQDGSLFLWGNRICPNTGNIYLNNTTYPECLAPEVNDALYVQMEDPNNDYAENFVSWEEWIWEHLGYIELPNHNSGFNHEAQFIQNADGTLACELEGCTDPRAQNYWPEATKSCGVDSGDANYCCTFDHFLHFPWGNSVDGTMNDELGDQPDGGGSFGGGMTLYEMVQALHAPICGFQYNSFGDVDVINGPLLQTENLPGACDYDSYFNLYGYLPEWTINACEFEYASPPTPIADGKIDVWDGLWLRSWSGYHGDSSSQFCRNINDEEIRGDARPLEFIQRVGQIAYCAECDPTEAQYWFGLAFPYGFANYSMEGIQYWEDYLISGGTDPTPFDVEGWMLIGRIDIATFVQNWMDGIELPPEHRPDDYELWETAPVHVSMSYSQKFVSEAEAGFTLYPQEGSPGVLTRSGQWQCDDGGPSEICYTSLEACGVAPSWVDECIPCGDTENGSGGICVPLTLDVAAEGHEKITRTKTINIPYFHNGLSSTIKGQNLYTASMSSSNHPYFYGVTNGYPHLSTSETQFDVSFGHIRGSGSKVVTDSSGSGNIGASQAVYKQYASLLLDDEAIGFDTGSYFMITSGSDIGFENGKRDDMIYALNFKRKKFEDQLENGTWTLSLHGTGSEGPNSPKTIHLTDNSLILEKPSNYGNAGRRFDIISGSAGTPYLGYKNVGDRYGWFYPDAGIMIFGEKLIYEFSGSMGADIAPAEFNPKLIGQSGSKQLYPDLSLNRDGRNALRFLNLMRGMGGKNIPVLGDVTGSSLVLNGQKEVSEVIYVCRLSAEDFNFTNNFSVLSGSGRQMYGNSTPGLLDSHNTSTTASIFLTVSQSSVMITGSDQNADYPNSIPTLMTDEGGDTFNWPGSNVPTFHGNPHTFITGVQLYDEHGEMVATANLSKPFKKASDREAVIKVKLTF